MEQLEGEEKEVRICEEMDVPSVGLGAFVRLWNGGNLSELLPTAPEQPRDI